MSPNYLIKTSGIIIGILVIASCGTSRYTKLANGKQIDKRLVGTWVGSETGNQQEGVTISWEMAMHDDATYVQSFESIKGQEINTSFDAGNWWVENGKLYEFHQNSGKTDIYKYEVLNKNKVKYKMFSTDLELQNKEYEFIDTRKEEEDNTERDGSSPEKAIKVKSIGEEYEYVRNVCPNCKMLQQSLISVKKKPYDLLEFEDKNGNKKSYYFDISSFYGKY